MVDAVFNYTFIILVSDTKRKYIRVFRGEWGKRSCTKKRNKKSPIV